MFADLDARQLGLTRTGQCAHRSIHIGLLLRQLAVKPAARTSGPQLILRGFRRAPRREEFGALARTPNHLRTADSKMSETSLPDYLGRLSKRLLLYQESAAVPPVCEC